MNTSTIARNAGILVTLLAASPTLAVERVTMVRVPLPQGLFMQANGASTSPVISPDGRYVAFVSAADNLWSLGSDSTDLDVFLKDRVTGDMRMISRKFTLRDTSSFTGNCVAPSITLGSGGGGGAGLRVAFSSDGVNTVGGCSDSNAVADIYSGAGLDQAEMHSTFADGSGCPTQANGACGNPVLSTDGTRLAFDSVATNLVTGDSNGDSDIFIRILPDGSFSRASIRTAPVFPFNITQANGPSYKPVLNSAGTIIVFESDATNLATGDTNNRRDIFVRDLSVFPGVTSRISVATDGNQANGNSTNATISADGRWIAFQSSASNLVAGDNNGDSDIFLHDRNTGTTTRISVGGAGQQADGPSTEPSISADGRLIAFTSTATNLAGGTDGIANIFIHEVGSGATGRLSFGDGALPNGPSGNPAISADGLTVAFQSLASNLYGVDNDTNGVSDIFVASVPPLPGPADDCRTAPLILGSGSLSGSASWATLDGGASCHLSTSSSDVWVRYRSPAGGLVRILGSTSSFFRIILSVHAGCPHTLGSMELACTGAGFPNEPTLMLQAAAGEDYWVRLAGDGFGIGSYSITILPVPSNEWCPTAMPIGDGSFPFDTRAAATDPFGYSCGLNAPVHDVWYLFTAPATGMVTASTCGAADFDTMINVYPPVCPPPVRIACGNNECEEQASVEFFAGVGERFYIQVAGAGLSGFFDPTGVGTLTVTTAHCRADFNNSGAISVQDIFDFLAAYFAADPRADFNASGAISVQDIFDYLAAYFLGCP